MIMISSHSHNSIKISFNRGLISCTKTW